VATEIDALVVTLGLDASKFNKNQKDALDAFKKTQAAAVKGAKEVEQSSMRAGEALTFAHRQALSLFAAFTGGYGVTEFFLSLAHADANLGRLNRNIGVSVETISRWQGAARIFGGTAEGLAGSFTSLSDVFAGWKIGIISPMVADLRAISTAGGKVIDVNKGVDQALMDLADNLKAIHDSGPNGPAEAGLLGRRLGLDPAFVDLLLRGSAGMKEILDYVQRIGAATPSATDAAGEFEKRWGQIGLKAESIGRKLGVFTAAIKAADFLNLTPSEAWDYLTNKDTKTQIGQPLFPGGAASRSGPFKSNAEREAFIRAEAVKGPHPIDPNVAVGVWTGEGKGGYVGDRGSSFGPFQLHYGNVAGGGMAVGGLGDIFTKKTGLDARNPATEAEQIRFSLDWMREHGTSAWHGYKGPVGESPGARSAAQSSVTNNGGSTSTSTSEIKIDTVNVYAKGENGAAIANDFRDAILKRQNDAASANNGQQ
jgi:hypothetical protein